jgi:hypothetical protein
MKFSDRKLGIHMGSAEIHQDFDLLMRFNCPDVDCEVVCQGGWSELKDHVKKVHQKLLW